MDVESTIAFLLDQAAKHDARIAQIEELLVRGAKMLVSNQQANREVDRRISALVDSQFKTEEANREVDRRISALVEEQFKTEQKFRDLSDAQKITEVKLQALLDSLGKSGNGH